MFNAGTLDVKLDASLLNRLACTSQEIAPTCSVSEGKHNKNSPIVTKKWV